MQCPFSDLGDRAVMRKVCDLREPPDTSKIRVDCPLLLRAFVLEGIDFDPAHRPTFAELAHRFCPLDAFLAKHLEMADPEVQT